MPELDLGHLAEQRGDHCPRCLSQRTVLPSGFLIDVGSDSLTCWYACRCGHRWSTGWRISTLASA